MDFQLKAVNPSDCRSSKFPPLHPSRASLNIAGSSSLIFLFLTAFKSATLEDLSLHVLTGASANATPAKRKSLVDATKSKWLSALLGFALEDNRALGSVLSLTDVFGALWQLKGLERFDVKQP
ncbi:hypothetical protein K443DRAFT_647247 [Laccaria amethystina LaAM-08-1]|uniref:Uncharacterized protein n=1 Tax=Laccaria amethystina LaAM-08-1 TaxID=1095629 RepID=A0A0C9WW87_9AGAR|nr:hypothetical protein K443DRAFT_647247 [Laccaria amethystina LaAM-08-1]